MRSLLLFALILAWALPTAAAPVAKSTGAKMCVLTQSDFRAAGLTVNAQPSAEIEQDGASAYCVYRGKSGATGGVELDVFYPAGASPAEVEQTFQTVLNSDPGAGYQPEGVRGADRSMFSLTIPQNGHAPFAANAVQRGALVFAISLPAAPQAKAQLQRLSQIVLGRLSK